MTKLHTRLRLVKLPSHFLMQLYPNYTQKIVITYTNQNPILLDNNKKK